MVETIVITFFISCTCSIILFIIGLYISRFINSPYFFYFIAILSSFSIVFVSVYLKLQTSWFTYNQLIAFALGGFSIQLSLKFLELAFGYQWIYVRQMPLILVIFYLIALPKMPETEVKLLDLNKQNARRESILPILTGIFQFIIYRLIIYSIPYEWVSFSSSSFPVIIRYLRYGILSFILYLSIAFVTNFGYGIYTLLFNIRMHSAFPSFPFIGTSLRDFWSYRWNNLIKTSLHTMSFIVIPKLIDPIMSMNKTAKGLCAFTLSGLIHEYVIWFISDKWSGKNMIFFLLHGFGVLLEINMKLPAKPETFQGKLIGWIWAIMIMLITIPLFFDPLIDIGVFSNMKHTFQ